MKVKKIEKKNVLSIEEFIKFQLMVELVFNKKITLNPSELDVLVLIVVAGEIELGVFCTETVKILYNIEKMEQFAIKSQNIRNIVNKLSKKGLVEKTKATTGKKWIRLDEKITIHFRGNNLLSYNYLCYNEPIKETGNNKTDIKEA